MQKCFQVGVRIHEYYNFIDLYVLCKDNHQLKTQTQRVYIHVLRDINFKILENLLDKFRQHNPSGFRLLILRYSTFIKITEVLFSVNILQLQDFF